MIPRNDHVLEHIDEYVHEVLERDDTEAVERHCADCASCRTALTEARKRFTALQALPPREASEQLIRKIVGNIDAYEARRRRLRRTFGWGTLIATAASVLILASLHIYYANLTPSPYDVALLGQTKLFPGSAGSMCIRVANHVSGVALAGVPVDIELRGKSKGQAIRLASLQTNAQGIVQPRFDVPDWADGDYELRVIAQPDGKTEEVVQPIRLQRSWKLMLSSDKPVYQPGQEIHLRALALRRPDLKPVGKEEATFAISDPKGNVIFKKQASTSAYGITATDCLLASEVIEGAYTIACKIGDTESKLTVEVKKYVLPKFKIDVAGLDAYYQPGQTVKGKVHAEYFFGGPVANGLVDVDVRSSPPSPLAGDGPGVRGPANRLRKLPGAADQDPNLIQRLSVQTDAAGDASFQFDLPKALLGRPQDSGDARIFLEFKVRDTAGQLEKRTVSRVVTSQPLRIEVIPEGGTLVPGVSNTIYLFVSYADGRPVPKATVVHEQQKVTTNDLGVATIQITPASGTPGGTPWTILNLRASDGKGQTAARQVTLTSGDSNYDFLIRTDKAVYTGGETMQLTALGGGPSVVYVDLIKDGQTYLSEAIAMKDGQGQLAVDLPADLGGTVELCAYRFGPEGLPVRKTRALYIKQARQLNIQTKPDKDEYRPGRSAKLDFLLTDAHGKPTPGALSLAAVDEAVFSVLEQAPGMERTFFTLEQEILQPIYAIYPWVPDQQTPVPAEDRNEFEQALFSRTAQTVSGSYVPPPRNVQRGGRGRINTAPAIAAPAMVPQGQRTSSPHSLSLFSFTKKANEVAETRRIGLQRVEMGWWLLAAALALTGYTALWLFARLRWIVIVHGAMMSTACLLLSFAVLTPRYREAAMRPLGGAMDFALVEAKMTAGEDTALETEHSSGPTIRVRQHFPETLLWRPELITDDQGRATLDLALADSITTWRLTASAVSADGRLGGAETPIRVFQPFFVDLNLPVALTRNDEVTIPVVVYNYLGKPQAVELTLTDADWFERLDDAVKTLELKPKEVRSTSYRLRVKKVGNHPLQVMAKGSELADAIKRSVEVVPDGQKIEQVVTDRLNGNIVQTVQIPEQSIPDSHKILVKLYPGVFSQVVEGVDGMLRQPFG
jgi:hypothetical protein